MSVESGLGTVAQACRAMTFNRSTFYRTSQERQESKELRGAIIDLSEEQPRYGYRRVTAVIRREGQVVNPKRVQRVRRAEGLQVRKKQRKTRRTGSGTARRRRAERRNEVWSWDFVHDMTEQGSRFRVLTLIDEHTRQCLAIRAGWSLRAGDVIATLEEAISIHGRPENIRSDNGPEFIAYHVQDWLESHSIGTMYIKPGSPWEQAYIESFHDKLRDECMNRELFSSLTEASTILEEWRQEYNEHRPHSSLGYRTPGEYARLCNPHLRSGIALTPMGIANHRRNHQPKTPAELQF